MRFPRRQPSPLATPALRSLLLPPLEPPSPPLHLARDRQRKPLPLPLLSLLLFSLQTSSFLIAQTFQKIESLSTRPTMPPRAPSSSLTLLPSGHPAVGSVSQIEAIVKEQIAAAKARFKQERALTPALMPPLPPPGQLIAEATMERMRTLNKKRDSTDIRLTYCGDEKHHSEAELVDLKRSESAFARTRSPYLLLLPLLTCVVHLSFSRDQGHEDSTHSSRSIPTLSRRRSTHSNHLHRSRRPRSSGNSHPTLPLQLPLPPSLPQVTQGL